MQGRPAPRPVPWQGERRGRHLGVLQQLGQGVLQGLRQARVLRAEQLAHRARAPAGCRVAKLGRQPLRHTPPAPHVVLLTLHRMHWCGQRRAPAFACAMDYEICGC